MTWVDIKEAIKVFGLPTIFFAGILWSLFKKYLILGHEDARRQEVCKIAVADEKERTNQMREERDMWRDMALRGTDLAERGLNTLEKAAAKL